MNTKLLEEIGLTKGEIKVYLTLLSFESSTTGPIITKSKVSRSKVYEILERLKEKGLVTEVIKDQVKHFQALSPNKILEYIKNKKELISNQEEEFKLILPELLTKQKVSENNDYVKTYVGLQSIKTFYIEMIEKLGQDEYLGINFSNKSAMNKPLILMFHKFHRQRIEKGAKAKILCTKNSTINKNMKSDKTYEFRLTDDLIPNDISIFKDTIVMFIWGDIPKVFAITSKEHADNYRNFFYSIWRKSRPL